MKINEKTVYNQTLKTIKALGFKIVESKYHSNIFGSWYISINSTPCRRIVCDGRDGALRVEEETDKVYLGSSVWDEKLFIPNPNKNKILLAIDKLTGSEDLK